jgi:hypothetical protein
MSTGGLPRRPPSLLHLSIASAVSNIQCLYNLTSIPENIVEELFEASPATQLCVNYQILFSGSPVDC